MNESPKYTKQLVFNEPNLYMWHFNQCDVKKCSGKKLAKHKKIKQLKLKDRFQGIVLVAHAQKVLSINDKELAEKKGIAVIDCSWNKINELDLETITKDCILRRLPFLLASNPCHFGRPFELNCAEALSAALFILNYYNYSINLMQSFSWGHVFFKVNEKFLDLYVKKPYESQEIDKLSIRFAEFHQKK